MRAYPLAVATATLPASASDQCGPYPYPSETRDRRSWAIPRPAEYPKSTRTDRKRPLSPLRRKSGFLANAPARESPFVVPDDGIFNF